MLDAGHFISVNKKTYEQKLKSAIDFLGTRWVLHPKYRFDPRHGYTLRKLENAR